MVAIELPAQYGWVVLGAGVGTVLTNFYLTGAVMSGRTKYDIKLPNCYGTPGYHKNADDFNRAQRSHQNYVEGLGQYVTMALIGGIKHPLANAIGSICFCIGSILYQVGYIDSSLDVETARHKKGALIKWFGFLTAFYSSGAFAYDLITSSN